MTIHILIYITVCDTSHCEHIDQLDHLDHIDHLDHLAWSAGQDLEWDEAVITHCNIIPQTMSELIN